jgi:ribosomal protein L7/L12
MSTGTQIALGVGIALVIFVSKLIRAETGLGLKDAKEFVDRLRQNP